MNDAHVPTSAAGGPQTAPGSNQTQGVVYLNGDFVDAEAAFVSVNDRGFLFADACYEATPAFTGRFLLLDRHLTRLQDGLDFLRINFSAATLAPIHQELLRRNGHDGAELAMVYAQITRGVAPRSHAFPDPSTKPTVYLFSKAVARMSPEVLNAGCSAITLEDLRWARPDIKTTGLLPNVLAQQAATEAGVTDAILFRPGDEGARIVTEGAHNNVFIVIDNTLITAPTDRSILPGVTRQFILELAQAADLTVKQRPFTVTELHGADEVFFSGTTTEVRPTVVIDGHQIGSGRPGPVTRRLQGLYDQHIAGLSAQ